MKKLPERSAFFSGPSGWKEIDPDHGLVKVEMDDPRVAEAQRLQVKFLPGKDLAVFVTAEFEAEIARLTQELEAKQEELVSEQVKFSNLNESFLRVHQEAAVARTELASANEARKATEELLTAEISEHAKSKAEAISLNGQLTLLEEAKVDVEGRLNARIAELEKELRDETNKPATSLPADKQRISELEGKVLDGQYSEALADNTIVDLQTDNRAKGDRIRALEFQVGAQPAPQPVPPPLPPQPSPSPVAVATPVLEPAPAPGWFARRKPVRMVREHPLSAFAAVAVVLMIFSMWFGSRYWAPTPNQQALTAQADLKVCNSKLAYAQEVQTTTEGARDAANDLAATALAELDKTRKVLLDRVATAPVKQEPPPAEKPKDETRPVVEKPKDETVLPKGDKENPVKAPAVADLNLDKIIDPRCTTADSVFIDSLRRCVRR